MTSQESGSEFDRAEQQQVANPLDDTRPGLDSQDVPTEADPADVSDQADAVLPDDQPATTTWASSGASENRARLGEFDPES